MDFSLDNVQDWILDNVAVTDLLAQLHFRERTINYILQAIHSVNSSPDKTDFFDFCTNWLEYIQRQPVDSFPVEWQTLAVVAAFPAAIHKHRARNIPFDITRATLFDFDRRMEETYERFGEWKFRSLPWFRNHISGNFFQLGRLQYVPGPFGFGYRIYRDNQSGKIIPLAVAGMFCSASGWPSYKSTFETAFETILRETQDGVIGHPVQKNGSIAAKPIQLTPGSPLLFDTDSTVLQIHIPWGDKLTRDRCVQSLQMAKTFYAKYFPELTFCAFRTGTWLLDPELSKVLSPTSNIVAFGQLFHPVAYRDANDNQLLERAFNSDRWENCVATNSLQKAILHHHQNGGEFRVTAGFILLEEVLE